MHTGDIRLHKQVLDGVAVLEVENVEAEASGVSVPPAEKIFNVRQTNIKNKNECEPFESILKQTKKKDLNVFPQTNG